MKKYFPLVLSLFLILSVNANADTLGQGQRFFVSPQYDAQSRTAVNATLRHISDKVYFYVENNYWNGISEAAHSQALNQISALALEFDKRIYPIETQFFGSEPNPGVDDDSRITILLTPLIENAGGYFDTAHEHFLAEVSNSNQREMIYLNADHLANQSKMLAFLAHEFQHLISFNQKENLRNVSDDTWLNELRSEYAVTLMGYNNTYEGSHLERRANALAENPSDSLTEWKNLPADYGQIGMFGEYIAERWSPQVIADTLKSKSAGFSSLAESLAGNSFKETFLDIFRNWLIANFLNDASVDAKLGYSKTSLAGIRVASTKAVSNLGEDLTFAVSDSIKDWQGKWYDISQLVADRKNILKIAFSSPSLASFHVSYVIFRPDGKFQVYVFNPAPNFETLYIPDIGVDVSRIVLMPIKKDKFSGFSANESAVPFTFSMERIAVLPSSATLASLMPAPVSTPGLVSSPAVKEAENLAQLADGSLIRAEGDYKVYQVRGSWRRHILSPKIFSFYPGLGFDKVIVVPRPILDGYKESSLVRSQSGKRVYTVDESGKRRWLNISAEQFSASGRAWDSIFNISLSELNFYGISSSILK